MARITLPGRGAIDLDAEGAQIDNILMDGQTEYTDAMNPGDASQAVNETHFDANSLPLWDMATAYSRGDQVRYNDGTTTQFYELLSATDTGTTPGTDTTVWARHSDTPHFGSINFGSLNVPASEHGATLQINHSNGINFTSSGTPNTIGITYTGGIANQDDVDISTPPTTGQILEWNGSDWIPGDKSAGIDEVNDGTTTVSITGGEDLQFRHGSTNERTAVAVTNESGNPRVTISTNIPDAVASRTGTSTGGLLTNGQAATLASAIQETDITGKLSLLNNSNVYTVEYDGNTLGASIDIPALIDGRITTTAPAGTTIDSSWLPDVNYGVVRSFDAGTSDRTAALALRNAAPSGHDWDIGDVAVISYTDSGVVETESFMYVGSANSTSTTTNTDWRTISTTPVLENLRQLADTPNANPTTDRQVLIWDAGSNAWVYGTVMGGATGHIGANSITTDELNVETGSSEADGHLITFGTGNQFSSTDPATFNTNLGYTTAATTGTVTSSTGSNATLPAATSSLAGLMTNADKAKLDGIEENATEINALSDIDDVTFSSLDNGHIIKYDMPNTRWTNAAFEVAPNDLTRGTNPTGVNGQAAIVNGSEFEWKNPFVRAYATGTAYAVLENFTHGDDLYIVDTAIDATNTVADPANLPTGTVTRILNGAQTGNEIVTAVNAATTTGRIDINRLNAEVVDRDHIALFWDTAGNDPNNLELPHVVVSGTRTDLELTTVQNFLEMGGKGWVANRRYFPGDVVVDNGGTGTDWRPYIALTDHESETGRPAADTTNWTLMTFSMDNLSDFRGYQDQSGTSHTSLVAALDQDIITVNNTGTTSDPVYQWINEDRGTMLLGSINTAHPNADISVTRVDGLLAGSTTGSGKNVLLTLQDGSVNEARLADNAVSVPKIDDGTRTPTAGYAVTVDGTDTTQFAYAPLQNKVSDDTGLYGLNHFDDTSTNDFSDLFDNTFFPGGGANAPGAGQFSIWHHPTEGINGRGIIINPTDATSPTAIDFEAVLDRAIANEIEIHWVFSIPSQGLHVECQTREGGLRTKYDGLGGSFAPFNGSFAFQFDYIGRNLFTGGYTTSGNFTTTFVEVNHKLVVTVDEIQHGPNSRVLATNATGTVGWDQITTAMIADDAVTTTQIADDAVTQDQVGDDAIGRDQLDFVSTATTTAGRVVALRGDNELDAIQVSGGTAGHIAADSITYDELHFETGQTETAGRLLALGDPATGQFRTIDMGTLGQDNNLIFSDIGTGTTATLEQYIDENGTTQNVRSAAITGGQFVITIASFTPSASLIRTPSTARLNWDTAATQVRVDVDNPDGVSRYVAGIRGLFLDGGTADQRANFTLGTASNVPAAGVDYTIDITPGTLQFAPVDGSGTILSSGLTGGTSRVVVTMNDNDGNEVTGLGLDTTFTWNSPAATLNITNLTGRTFLQTYTSTPYTVGQTNISAANTSHLVTATGNGTISSTSGSGTLTFTTPIHKDNTGTNVAVQTVPTFTRPRAVTGSEYTAIGATVTDNTVTYNFTYPSWHLLSTLGVTPVRSDVISGDAFSISNVLGNQARTFGGGTSGAGATVTVSGSDSQTFWFAVRASATQPTVFQAFLGGLWQDLTTTTETLGLEPDTPPSGYTAEDYTLYGFTVQPGDTLIRIG